MSLPSFDALHIHDIPSQKFAHTRALLSALARQYKPLENYDSDAEGDEFGRVSTSFVNRVVGLLVNELEDDLKVLLKATYGLDDDLAEQNVLELMHKHRDDIAGVPFLFLTPTRRPISRPSSRASMNSLRLYPVRPDTPQSAPSSPLAQIFRRPHTPLTSPLAGNGPQATSYMSTRSEYSASPSSSPILTHAHITHAQYTASLPASPLSSPRLLNAKANEFKPIQRPLSAASSNPGPRTETPSPDLWSHSPFRASSNLAIAAPLFPDQSALTRSLTPSSNLRSSLTNEDSDEEDPFDPFSRDNPPSFLVPDIDPHLEWANSTNSNSSRSPEDLRLLDMQPQFQQIPYGLPYDDHSPLDDPINHAEVEAEAAAMLTDGMTPFDVLSSVFGSSLAPSELEEALAANGFDFERAMASLIDRALPQNQQGLGSPLRGQRMGGGMAPRGRGFSNTSPGHTPPRYVNGRPVQGGNRVCRYFVAGECLRADCRFSHDLERALCRFWLRGTCAKQENCEFLHHLPKDVDISSLNIAMARANVPPGTGPLAAHTMGMNPPPQMNQPDEFPILGYDTTRGRHGGAGYMEKSYNVDPSRTRFSAAVKKPAAPPPLSANTQQETANNIARREAMAIVAPRPSPRLRLRPPSLLPTLATGEAVNVLYMSYRSRALQLGAARNACLSRAADAWRRGDGAAAKRFSREGHDLNAKMSVEMGVAATNLVRERAKLTEMAVRGRDTSWSDDPGDRTARGRACGGGLGVCLGVAGTRVDGGDGNGKLSSEERTESVLDLHGLHAGEATEVLEEFLLALEQEHFYGLAYVIVGEEKHTGTQDTGRGASRARLATGVKEWIHRWGYPWSERDGIICIDPLTHASE